MELLDLRDPKALRARRPLIIAHRGGVIGPNAPECSLEAVRRAAACGYDMVELDVQETKDRRCVVFHDDDLERCCGVRGRIGDLALAEATAVGYRASDQRIASLEEAMGLCRSLGLGVMLELKDPGRTPASGEFYERIAGLIGSCGLLRATMVFPPREPAKERFPAEVLFQITREQSARVEAGERPDFPGLFWFATAAHLPSEAVRPLQSCGVLVIPAINAFRYPAHEPIELARQDARRLKKAKVDGFQIDSVYGGFFRSKITGTIRP